jgi:hypothetical protein
MQTKREYAASLGLAVAGARGRLSREAHAAISKAEADGMTFSDAKPTVNTPRAAKPVSEKPVIRDTGIIGEVIRFHDLDAQFTGKDSHGKTHTVNARQVCRLSGFSITSCPCGQDHEVLVSSMEHIKVTPKGR